MDIHFLHVYSSRYAMGYIYGGVVGGALGCRAAFWIESLLLLPLAVFGFVSKEVYLKDVREPLAGDEAKNKDATIWPGGLLSDLKELPMCKIYTTNVFGNLA